ncbi:MAG: type II toxin-antitoxin system VapC family toxin [Armatimonadota bacterium]|nr:type II toxin-antitoxin system VapC family toxin [Armatimonadota bacterium]
MTKLLLDTHALLWALGEPEKLSARAREAVEDPASLRLVSSASAWEIATKYRLGRLPGAEVLLSAYSRHLRTLHAVELTITSEHAILAGMIRHVHRDPFDRVLAAQARIEGAYIVSRDEVFDALGAPRLW